MLGKIFGSLVIISILSAVLTGKMDAVGLGALEGAGEAVRLTITLAGVMCLWNGVMRVAKAAGLIERLAALNAPLLRLLIPNACAQKKNGSKEAAAAIASVSANIGANLIGIGNAATPLGIDAMKRLHKLGGSPSAATRDMISFAVFNCASLQIIPTTLLTLRAAAGSSNAYEILPAVWLCSFAGAAASIIITKIMGAFADK